MKRVFALPIVLAGSCWVLWKSSPTMMSQISNQSKAQDSSDGQYPLTKTYIWGNGVYQPRPDASMRFRNFEPKLIRTFLGLDSINLKNLSFGEYHEAGIDVKGDVYVWKKHLLDSSFSDGDHERQEVVHLDDGKNNKQIRFSKGFLWVLKENGEVYRHSIFAVKGTGKDKDLHTYVEHFPKKIEPLKNIVQIETGNDHLAALDANGNVWTMGDDTEGQCGLGAFRRNCAPPFFERRVNEPMKIQRLNNVTKIACGGNHTIALNTDGVAFGWGSNSNLQLSHLEEFAVSENPLLAVYDPLRIEKNLGPIIISDIAAGDEFSIFIGRNRYNGETEVFACGHNLHGELGVGNLSHVKEITKLESLSNYKVKSHEGEQNIKINQISCGKNHCMALLNIGAVLEWGANEHGQLGNKKRMFSENPVVVKDLANENVLGVFCGENNSAVICEATKDSLAAFDKKRKSHGNGEKEKKNHS